MDRHICSVQSNFIKFFTFFLSLCLFFRFRARPGRGSGPWSRAAGPALELPAPSLQRDQQAADQHGPAVPAAKLADLRVQHAVGQPGRGVRHAGTLRLHHLLARAPAGNKEASRRKLQSHFVCLVCVRSFVCVWTVHLLYTCVLYICTVYCAYIFVYMCTVYYLYIFNMCVYTVLCTVYLQYVYYVYYVLCTVFWGSDLSPL